MSTSSSSSTTHDGPLDLDQLMASSPPPFDKAEDTKEIVEQFIQSLPLSHEIELFILLCSVTNHIGTIVKEAPKYTVSDALLENIKIYVYVTLLLSKLSAYKKDNIPCEHVFSHSKIKKMIKASLADIDADASTIYDLALAMIDGTSLSISVPLCACLALLRSMYCSDSKYWDQVDLLFGYLSEGRWGQEEGHLCF
ncbi:hypothetical protein BDQ12DRAFT_672070 [Crucibulum laeve]|uniref:Uncharacterized protein n=1 Tax=Crucibulum laeve TaxID=68775 RepID=A0A5C3LE99_9AGAR|nr:hypothetical protein BDQ12DRAFT_672070 [Crucibulum laeve]